MKKFEHKTIELQFEIGKTYKTKFQTGELFTITNVNYPFAKDKWASSFIACAYYFRRS